MARVVLAMSGGVDSSVAAWLLCQAGHEVVGVFMRHGIQLEACGITRPARHRGCCTAADAEDARRVAGQLGVPFYAINFESEFQRIVDYFVNEYVSGRTPNPCVVCNMWIKFGKLFAYADSIGADYVATGHYARLVPVSGESVPALCRGGDVNKDQSYVLFGIGRERLRRLLFPVGGRRKEEIREMARRLGFPVAEKPDSQEICFVPDGDHARLVRQRRVVDTSGEIVTTRGEVMGRHEGIERFTVGQRKGLGIAFGERKFVVRVEPETRRVVVGSREELARDELTADQANWLVDPPSEPFRCEVKIRYRSPALPATVEPLDETRFRVRFDSPSCGVAPGQAVVCYRGDRVLGGGWIQ